MEPRNGNHPPKDNEKKESSRILDIPDIPRQVDIRHLDDNGRLVSPEVLNNVIKLNLLDTLNYRTSKTRFKNLKGDVPKFSIIKTPDGDYYSIYQGEQHKKHLGEGGFGSVKLAQNIITGEWVALKVMDSDKTSKNIKDAEVANLKNTDNYFHDSIYIGKKRSQYELLMKLAPGTGLFDLIKDKKIPSLVDKLRIAIGCLKSIETLHKKNILHRDIKPSNFVYDTEKGLISIVDFGLAIYGNLNQLCKKFGGTEAYHAPEQNAAYENKQAIPYNEKTEVYALGVTLVNLFYDNVKIDPVIHVNIIDSIKKTLSNMVNKDPQKRPSISSAIIELKSVFDILLDIMPTIRNFSILNVDDYRNNNQHYGLDTELFRIWTSDSHVMQEVFLVNDISSPLDPYEYAKIKKTLESHGFMVSPKVYLLPPITPDNLPDSLATLINAEAKNHCFPAQVMYLHHDGHKVNVTQYNDLPSYYTCRNEVIRGFYKEIERLEGRIKSAIAGKGILKERLAFLNDTLMEIKRKSLDLNQISRKIDLILENTKSAFPLGAILKTFFTGQSGPDGRQELEKIKGKINTYPTQHKPK